MRHGWMVLLLLTASLHADCTVSVFPSQTKSLEFRQTTTSELGESVHTLTWSNREIHGERVQWTEVFAAEGRDDRTSTAHYRCSKDGITPELEGDTKFTGVQYGNDLKPGSEWTWTWAGTGISAAYTYRVTKTEKVTVPAGTFDAARVEYTAIAKSETRGELPQITGTLWMAEGVGLVKQVEDDPALGLIPDQTTLELITRQ
ncbi:MAG TPA: hypothetical protein VF787_17980 [Thermoanaerobaculia bacterium]